jgi:hypothetical protein
MENPAEIPKGLSEQKKKRANISSRYSEQEKKSQSQIKITFTASVFTSEL